MLMQANSFRRLPFQDVLIQPNGMASDAQYDAPETSLDVIDHYNKLKRPNAKSAKSDEPFCCQTCDKYYQLYTVPYGISHQWLIVYFPTFKNLPK
jgi:hypothetical protein